MGVHELDMVETRATTHLISTMVFGPVASSSRVNSFAANRMVELKDSKGFFRVVPGPDHPARYAICHQDGSLEFSNEPGREGILFETKYDEGTYVEVEAQKFHPLGPSGPIKRIIEV